MSIFGKHLPPHKLHPDILHWREGDELFARNVKLKGWFSKLMAFETGNLNAAYYFKAITDEGVIVVAEKESGHLHKVKFEKFIKKATNLSFVNRAIEQDLKTSQNYMELMENFQQAYNELEEADKLKQLLD